MTQIRSRGPARRAPLAACLAALAPAAWAAVPEGPEVVVTATRTARTADQSLAAVQIIDRAAIEASGALTLPELLEGLGGSDLVTLGGPFGKQSSLLLDGMESDHVLVLVDGVRAGSVSAGGFAWELLSLDQVERIEIVRGPRSALYGSEAVAGVIQIFTRRGGPARRGVAVAAGSYGTYRLQAAAQGGGERPWAVGLAQLGTRGLNATTPDNAFAFEPDRDPYRNLSLGGSMALALGPARLALRGLGASGRTRYDGYRDRDDYLQGAWSARLELPGTEAWQPTLLAGASRDRRLSLKEAGGIPSAVFDSRRWTFSWQNDLAVGEDGLLTAGLDHYVDRLDTDQGFPRDGRHTTGAFAQYQARWGGQRLLVGARRSRDQQFGWHSTGNVAWGTALPIGLDLLIAWGNAFKAPTFNDLYYPGSSNPDLLPERARTWEASLRGPDPWEVGRWELRLHHTRADQLIVFDLSTFTPQNVDRARVRGAQFRWSGRGGPWRASLDLAWLEPRNLTRDRWLPRRARRSARLAVDRQLGPLTLGLAWRGRSGRYDDAANSIRTGGYGLLALRARYRLAPRWTAALRWSNLLDRQYQEVRGYAQPGSHVLLELRYREG